MDYAGAVQLLQQCAQNLAASQKQLLTIVFNLAQDEWLEVRKPCMAYLQLSSKVSASERRREDSGGYMSHSSSASHLIDSSTVSEMCMDLFKGMVPSLQIGEQQGISHAQRLVTALQVNFG